MGKGKTKGEDGEDGEEKPSWKNRGGGTGENTPPREGLSTSHGNKCGNGHTANSAGECFTGGCPHHV